MIQIVYIAVGSYVHYAVDFLCSVEHFFPQEKKIVTVITDNKPYVENIVLGHTFSNKVCVEVEKTVPLVYPLINLSKPVYITSVAKPFADFIFYMDADTICKSNVPDYVWDEIRKRMEDDNIILPIHPSYALLDIDLRDRWIDGFYNGCSERDSSKASYVINEEYKPYGSCSYLISSFWGGKRERIIELNEVLNTLARKDLKRNPGYHIPPFMDENYMNKIAYDTNYFKFSLDVYNVFPIEGVATNDFNIVYQKMMKDYKFNRQ